MERESCNDNESRHVLNEWVKERKIQIVNKMKWVEGSGAVRKQSCIKLLEKKKIYNDRETVGVSL